MEPQAAERSRATDVIASPNGRAPSGRRYGAISLAFMAVGTTVAEILTRTLGLTHTAWQILTAGFHAGLVGALADWYAVHVLLHPAPFFMRVWPFKRHSDLLVRNRPKLEANIIAMVQDELLSPEKIADHLARVQVFERLLDRLGRQETLQGALDFARSHELLVPLANQLDRDDLAELLEEMLAQRLREVDLARPLGGWILRTMERGDHHRLWEGLLDAGQETLMAPESRTMVVGIIRNSLRSYLPELRRYAGRPETVTAVEDWLRDRLQELDLHRLAGAALRDTVRSGAHHPLVEDILERLHVWLSTNPAIHSSARDLLDDAMKQQKQKMRPVPALIFRVLERVALDRDQATKDIIGMMATYVESIRSNKNHKLRLAMNSVILSYAESLSQGDHQAQETFERLRHHLLTVHLQPTIAQLFNWLLGTLEEDLRDDQGQPPLIDLDPIADSLIAGMRAVLAEIRSVPQHPLRRKVDDAVRQYARKLQSGEAESTAFVARLRNDLLQHADLHGWIKSLLRGGGDLIHAQLRQADSVLWGVIHGSLVEVQDRVLSSPQNRDGIRRWLEAKTRRLIEENHSQIGTVIRTSLELFSDQELVRIIDQKFGDDLQFVRLNGAFLGFLIGVTIAAVLALLSFVGA